ncbi:hypothetical protein EUGRSUZ_H00298, partial [Eucalyptus grandis]
MQKPQRRHNNYNNKAKLSTTSSTSYQAKTKNKEEAIPSVSEIVFNVPEGDSLVANHFKEVEIFKSMEDWAEKNVLVHLIPVENCWQPQDFLPNAASDGFEEQVRELRERAREIPDDYFVALVGSMITEEALPTYQTLLNTLDGVRDETDMKRIEKTIQYLIGAGMDPRTENSPYLFFIYTSFQERATSISHGNTGRLAKAHGEMKLAQICGKIASDEKRHEAAYTKIMEKLFEIDPAGTVLALADMMRKRITMPAHLMYDGCDDNIFSHYSAVVQRLDVYTAKDYADVLEFLVRRWKVENLTGLSAEGRRAQDYVCGLVPKIRRLEGRASERAEEALTIPFSWVSDRQ